jgi:hypothetical protein
VGAYHFVNELNWPTAETPRLAKTSRTRKQPAGYSFGRPPRRISSNGLMVDLHSGEAEAIALALETKAAWLLIDERESRTMPRFGWACESRGCVGERIREIAVALAWVVEQ